MVKYNTNVDTSNITQKDFGTFWTECYKSGTDFSVDTLGMHIYGDDLYFEYTGYLSMTGYIPIKNITNVQVDGVEYINSETGEFSFKGYVKKSIYFYTSASSANFTEFSINPYELSNTTKTFYSNVPENNTIWGELIIPCQTKGDYLNWYNINNNNADNKMEFWSHNFVDTGFAPSDEHSRLWFYRGLDSSLLEEPSGFMNISVAQGGFNKLPILIHEDDIGKKNTIGPLLQEDGSEIYINLTII